jgi:hypothetical protein
MPSASLIVLVIDSVVPQVESPLMVAVPVGAWFAETKIVPLVALSDVLYKSI